MLLKESIRTNDLITKSKILIARFHPLMKALVLSLVVDRKVHEDRSVSYSISPFGRNVLELSEPILDRIKEEVKEKDSTLLTLMRRKG